jgi:sigma-B regulation protein RsbU (phosphoserine phosphatase)
MTTLINADLRKRSDIISTMLEADHAPLIWNIQSEEFAASEIGFVSSLPVELKSLRFHREDLPDGSWSLGNPIRGQQAAAPGMDIAARYLPAKGVSGDYCDLLPLSEGEIGLVVGDACGKGIGAARLMASVCVSLRARIQACSTAGDLLGQLNRVLCRDTPDNQFVTFMYGVWNVDSRVFTYSHAGHPPALHYQSATGCVSKLSVGGMVLGVCEDVEYPTASMSLSTGDALVLYTDGITEAVNAYDEVFGIHRLIEVVAKHGEESSEALATAILDTASHFARQVWEDDATVMVVKMIGI